MARNTWVQMFNDDGRGLSADGLTLATFTTSAALFPAIVFPANYFKSGKLIHLRARGIWAATATPSYTFRLQETAGTVVTLVTSAAIAVTALTNQAWVLDLLIQCRSEGTSGTLEALGDLNMGGVSGGPFYLPATGTAPATATVDTTVQQTWQIEAASTVSNAANTLKGIVLEVLTMN
jgi:hypothetical protein